MIYEISPETGTSDYFFLCRRKQETCFPHAHSHIEFVFVLEGELSLHIDEKSYRIGADTVAVVMPYQVHQYTDETLATTFHIACPPDYIQEYSKSFRDHVFSPVFVPWDPVLQVHLSEVRLHDERRNFSYPGSPDFFRHKALVYAALSQFLRCSTLVPVGALNLDVYRRAVVWITEHYTEEISLNQAALVCGVSAAHLSRVLKSRGNYCFSDIVNTLRIQKAKQMLTQTELSISQIALESGFGTIRNFNRFFQNYFHCTPRQFRNERRTQVN